MLNWKNLPVISLLPEKYTFLFGKTPHNNFLQVFEATLSNCDKFKPNEQTAAVQLFRAYAELEMAAREDLAALSIFSYVCAALNWQI